MKSIVTVLVVSAIQAIQCTASEQLNVRTMSREEKTFEIYLNPFDPLTRMTAKIWDRVFDSKTKAPTLTSTGKSTSKPTTTTASVATTSWPLLNTSETTITSKPSTTPTTSKEPQSGNITEPTTTMATATATTASPSNKTTAATTVVPETTVATKTSTVANTEQSTTILASSSPSTSEDGMGSENYDESNEGNETSTATVFETTASLIEIINLTASATPTKKPTPTTTELIIGTTPNVSTSPSNSAENDAAAAAANATATNPSTETPSTPEDEDEIESTLPNSTPEISTSLRPPSTVGTVTSGLQQPQATIPGVAQTLRPVGQTTPPQQPLPPAPPQTIPGQIPGNNFPQRPPNPFPFPEIPPQGQLVPGQGQGQLVPGQGQGQLVPGQGQGQLVPGQQLYPNQPPVGQFPPPQGNFPGNYNPNINPGQNQRPPLPPGYYPGNNFPQIPGQGQQLPPFGQGQGQGPSFPPSLPLPPGRPNGPFPPQPQQPQPPQTFPVSNPALGNQTPAALSQQPQVIIMAEHTNPNQVINSKPPNKNPFAEPMSKMSIRNNNSGDEKESLYSNTTEPLPTSKPATYAPTSLPETEKKRLSALHRIYAALHGPPRSR